MNKGNATKKQTKEREYTRIESFSVDRAFVFKNGGVAIDLTINGVKIYGANIVEHKNGDFVSFPQRQGKDGKYYHIVYVALSPEDTKAIIEETEKVLAED